MKAPAATLSTTILLSLATLSRREKRTSERRKRTMAKETAHVVMVDMPDMTAELFDAATEREGLGDRLPDGCLVHIAGPGPEGWRIVSVWESREKLQQFVANTLQPVHSELGVQPPTRSVVWDLYSLIK
jgi:hypothetical protein